MLYEAPVSTKKRLLDIWSRMWISCPAATTLSRPGPLSTRPGTGSLSFLCSSSIAEVAEAQPTPDPGLIRVRQRVGHLLSATAAATASRPLLAPLAAAPLSAAALPAAGSWADCQHRGVLSLLL